MAEPPRAGDDAPAIVIFGAAVRRDGTPSQTLRRRVEAAAAFGARLPSPWYVPTGAVGRFGASEASVMADLLAALGVPPDRVLLEETATSTLSSVRAIRRMRDERGLCGPVFAATSVYHLPRCLMLLRLAGVAAQACPPPAFPASHALLMRWYWRGRELPAVLVDGLLMLWLRATGRI
ncbi:MAG: YdcF family protein [Acetobacteraceae bacterium]|nr:YdcF family protein [Acetobacteraceae bacterium]